MMSCMRSPIISPGSMCSVASDHSRSIASSSFGAPSSAEIDHHREPGAEVGDVVEAVGVDELVEERRPRDRGYAARPRPCAGA